MKKFTVLLFTMVVFFMLGSISFSFAEDIDADATSNIDPQESEAGNVYEVQTKDELIEALGKLVDGDTILLVDNIDLEEASLTVTGEGKKTIDFNGFTITSNCSGTQMLYVTGGSELTLKDGSSAMNGGLFATKADGTLSNLIRVATDGKLVIESGSYHQIASNNGSGMIDSRGSNIITINGGTFTLDNVGTATNKSPWILNTSGKNERKIIVNGGTYNDDVYHQHFIFEVQSPVNRASKNNGDGTWTIVDAVAYINEQHKSGKWYTEERGYATLQEAIDALKETESTVEEVVTLLVDGQSAIASKALTVNKNGFTAKIVPQTGLVINETDDAYIVEEVTVFSVNSKEDLKNAIEEANKGDIIVIANDIVLDAPIVVSAEKNITIELNGKSISYESNVAGEDMITNNGNLTITGEGVLTYKNTDTTASNATTSVITNNPGATLTINGGSFINETSDAKAWQSGGIFPFVIDNVTNGSLGDTTLVINDGYFAGNYRTIRAFCNSTICKNTVVINGGVFEGQVWMQSSNEKAHISNLEITDGSFRPVGKDGSSVYIATSTATEATVTGGTYETRIGVDNTDNLSGFVSGGKFGSAVKDELCAEGFVPVQNDDGSYGVAAKKITIEEIFTYKGSSTNGTSMTTGYTINHAKLEEYMAENGIKTVEFGGVMAAGSINAYAKYFDFTSLAKTGNYNIIIRDITEKYYDLALIMTLYVSFDGEDKKFVNKEANLVDKTEAPTITYNEAKGDEE